MSEVDEVRNSLGGVLKNAWRCGLRPKTIIDVGVDKGTPELYDTFAGVKYVLVEPLAERARELKTWAARLGDAVVINAAAAEKAGSTTFYVHTELAGSSLHREADGPLTDGVAREVDLVALDDVCREHQTAGPYLVKIDTQGSELRVLDGAQEILKQTELIVLEASLFGFFLGGPQFGELVAYLKDRGFVVYDIFGAHYRPLDGALAQVDLVFVREDGPLRESHRFASVEQREEQVFREKHGLTGRILRKFRRLLSR